MIDGLKMFAHHKFYNLREELGYLSVDNIHAFIDHNVIYRAFLIC